MNTRLERLRKRRAELLAAQRALLDTADTDERELTGEEEATFGANDEQLKKLAGSIEREEQLAEAERTAAAAYVPENQPGIPAPGTPHPAAEQDRFPSFGHYLQAVARAGMNPHDVDPRLIPLAAAGLSEGIPADGGFLVGIDTSSELLRRTYDTGQLSRRCRRIPISAGSNGIKINGINETSRAAGSQFGGITAYWLNEGGTKTDSKPAFRQIELNLKKLIGLCYATDELLADAAALEAIITEAFPNVFAFYLDDAIVRGTGAGQPLGFLAGAVNAPRVRVAKETGQTATTIVSENVEKMYARMWSPGIGNAIWTINQDCWPQIFQLAHVIGVGGVPMFIPAGGITDGPAGTLLGRPIVPTEQCATLGTESDICFLDLSQYLLIDKGGIEQASSIHVRFLYDETTFRFVLRVDGQPIWASSLTPAQGTTTVSPFVTLAARA